MAYEDAKDPGEVLVNKMTDLLRDFLVHRQDVLEYSMDEFFAEPVATFILKLCAGASHRDVAEDFSRQMAQRELQRHEEEGPLCENCLTNFYGNMIGTAMIASELVDNPHVQEFISSSFQVLTHE